MITCPRINSCSKETKLWICDVVRIWGLGFCWVGQLLRGGEQQQKGGCHAQLAFPPFSTSYWFELFALRSACLIMLSGWICKNEVTMSLSTFMITPRLSKSQ